MVYIVFDLEWNSVYGARIHGYINEIIEIGAVMLDESFVELDHFSVLVKSKIGRRLQSHVQEMTQLSKKDLDQGLLFMEAFAQLKEWVGGRDHVALSWGDGDIRVLLANVRYHTSARRVRFLQNYCDLQEYFRHRTDGSRSQQTGLVAAGECLGLESAVFAQHRALDDSRLAAECFIHIFQKEDFSQFVRVCSPDFFSELEYKPHVISDIFSPLVDQNELYYTCACGGQAQRLTDWRFASRGFQAEYVCPDCKTHVKAVVSFKKMYKSVEIKRYTKPVAEESASA